MHVLKFPWEKGGGKKSVGASYGPDAIEKQFKNYPWRCSEDGVSAGDIWFLDLKKEFADKKSCETLPSAFRRISGHILSHRNPFVVLSGDNSCSFHTAESVAEYFPNPHLVVLDAHPDACDEKHDAHASWVRRLWEGGIVRPDKTIFFGIRDAEADEMTYVREKGAIVYSCGSLFHTDVEHAVDKLKFSRALDLSSALILVVDIDVVDPSQAPATGVPRAPGLDLRQVLSIICAFGVLSFPVKVGEICEVIPVEGNQLRYPDDKRPDPSGLTVLAAEAILRQMLRSFS